MEMTFSVAGTEDDSIRLEEAALASESRAVVLKIAALGDKNRFWTEPPTTGFRVQQHKPWTGGL
jgi:hypothetical protein